VNFSADRFVMSQKVEAQTLRASANNQGYQVKGDMRIGGTPVSVELRRGAGEPDAEVRMTGTLGRCGARAVRPRCQRRHCRAGPRQGRRQSCLSGDGDSRLSVEADFTQAKFDNLVTGWNKAQKAPARATFTLWAGGRPTGSKTSPSTATACRSGQREFDQNGDFSNRTFPVFALADGDKASLQLERTPDNLYRITMRGDTFDGRNFIKATMSGHPEASKPPDQAISMSTPRSGAVAGFKGEVLRNLDCT